MKKISIALLMMLTGSIHLMGQDPHRFDAEIGKFAQLQIPKSSELIVFTGSSSIRLWETLEKDCQSRTVVNTGFGGSEMSDLLFFLEETVLRFKPAEVYIYEGDNDINEGKDPKAILETAKKIVEKIWKVNSRAKIHLIGAKPSPSRWADKNAYLQYNALLRSYCKTNDLLSYKDVWEIMLDDKGRPAAHIFKEDSLHMNSKGYLLWKQVLCDQEK